MDPEEAMETVDEGRIERMASGGFSQQQKDEVKNEPSPQQGFPEPPSPPPLPPCISIKGRSYACLNNCPHLILYSVS